ncbi:hypothetical protein DFH11DRAFT_1880571 [Phellopilus nigrolimitatus]|nr:hypothetical protein DFH11DRAFT_1880571 [Phellopilus nigrolimitatus]
MIQKTRARLRRRTCGVVSDRDGEDGNSEHKEFDGEQEAEAGGSRNQVQFETKYGRTLNMGISSYLITPLVIVVVAAAAAIRRSHRRPLPSSPLPPNSRCSARQSPPTTEVLAQYLDLHHSPNLAAQMAMQHMKGTPVRPNVPIASVTGRSSVPAVRFGGGMTDVGGGVPPLLPGVLPTTSLSSSSISPTLSAPVNSATAPSGSSAASTTGLPPLPANVQVNPRIPELSAGEIPEIQEWMVPDRAYEARFRGMARCAKAELAAEPASMRARWWENNVLVEAGVAVRRRKEKFDLVHPHVPGSCEGGSKKARSRERLKVPGKLKLGEAKRNLNDPVVTPEAFVQSVIDDYGLSSSYHATIAKSIQKQLASNDVSVAPTESTPEVARGSLQGPDTEWWASWRKHLRNKDSYVRTHALSQSVPEPQGHAEKRLKFASAEDAAKDTRASHNEDSLVDVEMTEVNEDKMYEEMRIIIKQFSYYFHRDAHIIREQGSTYQKSLFLVGHPSDGPAIQDDDLRMSFLPLVAPVARSVAQTQSCQPIVNCLSDGELDWLNKGGLVSAIPMTFYFFSEKRVVVVASSCRICTRIRILPSRACFPLITHHHPDDDTTPPSAHTVGACASVQGRTDKERSEEIDRQIKEDSLKLCKECNILLLGAFALVFDFISDPQLTTPRPAPAFPAYPRAPPGSVGSVMLAIRKLNVDPVLPTNRVYANVILGYKLDGSGAGVTVRHLVKTSRVRSTLWADPIISRIMDRSTRRLSSCEVARFGHANYVPTRRTCSARAHQKSIDFVETRFNIGKLSIHMFDVGGQHSERKKATLYADQPPSRMSLVVLRK